MSAYALDNFIKRVFESPDLMLLHKINTDYSTYLSHLSDVGSRSTTSVPGQETVAVRCNESPFDQSHENFTQVHGKGISSPNALHLNPSTMCTNRSNTVAVDSVHYGRCDSAAASRRWRLEVARMLCYERALYPVITYPRSYDEVIALTVYHNFHAKGKLVFEMKQGGVTNYDVEQQQNDSIVVDAGVRGDAESCEERELYNLLSFPILGNEKKKAAVAAATAARIMSMFRTVQHVGGGNKNNNALRSNIANTPYLIPDPNAAAPSAEIVQSSTHEANSTGAVKAKDEDAKISSSGRENANNNTKVDSNHDKNGNHVSNANGAFTSAAKPETIVGVVMHSELGLATCIADVIFANLEEDSYLACTAEDSCCYMYRIDKGRQVMPRGVLSSHTGYVTRMAICRKASLYATCGTDGVLSIMDSLTLRCVCNLPHPAAVTCTTFSSDCRFLVTGCADHCCRVWSSRVSYQPTSIAVYAKHAYSIAALAPHPQGNVMASGCEGGAVHLWSVITTKKLYALPSHVHRGHRIRSLGFHRDGCVLVSVSDTRLVLSDVATGTITHTARPSDLQDLSGSYVLRRRVTELQEGSSYLGSPRGGRANSEAQSFHAFGTFNFSNRRVVGFGGETGVNSANDGENNYHQSKNSNINHNNSVVCGTDNSRVNEQAGGLAGSERRRRSSAFSRGPAVESTTFSYVLFAPSRVPANYLVICLSDKTVALVELILAKSSSGNEEGGASRDAGEGNVQDILSRASPTAVRRLRKMRSCASVTFPRDGEPSATGLKPVLWSTRTRAAVCCANAGPERRILLGDEAGNVYVLHFDMSSSYQHVR